MVLAGEQGIDVSQYMVDPQERNEYREALKLRPRTIERIVQSTPTDVVRVLRVQNMPDLNCPNLSEKVSTDARKMADVYYHLYLFENSLRQFISDTLGEKYGVEWWNTQLTDRIKNKAQNRMEKEDKNRWHSIRGAHPICYVDIDDLRKIIVKNQSDFEEKLPENPIEWFTQRINEIELSRNIIAHHNPLGDDDIAQLKRYFRQWMRQLSG